MWNEVLQFIHCYVIELSCDSSLTILCISPVSIPNPNYGHKYSKGSIWSLKDCTSARINVPCGHCSECIRSRQLQLCQRVQMESLSNYLFFATLTYCDDMLPRITTSSGFDLPYADWHDLQLLFKRLRANNSFTRPFRYLAVSERGSSKGRPHFHILFFLPKRQSDDPKLTPLNLEHSLYTALFSEWKRKIGGSKRSPVYKPLFHFKQKIVRSKIYKNFDLHYVVPSVDDDGAASVAFYVTKYMLKRSDKETRLQQALRLNLDDVEYDLVWNLVKSRVDTSLFFGLNPDPDDPFHDMDPKIFKYIRNSVDKSSEFAKFINPVNGQTFPLARYYKNVGRGLYTVKDALRFHDDQFGDSDEDSFYVYDQKHVSQLVKSVRDYEKKILNVADRGDIDNINFDD